MVSRKSYSGSLLVSIGVACAAGGMVGAVKYSTPPHSTGDGKLRPTCQKQKECFKRKLSCVSFNSMSIVNKRLELSSLLASKFYELVAITETFLESTINSSAHSTYRGEIVQDIVVEFSWLFTRVCAALEKQISKLIVKFYGAR